MGDLIDDDMLQAFAVVAEPQDLAAGLLARFGGTIDRLSFYLPYKADPEQLASVLEDLHAG